MQTSLPNTMVSFAIALSICLLANTGYAFDKNKRLIASTLEYPPYEFSEGGVAKGIAIEIIREAVRRTGVDQVEFNFYPWKRAVLMARNGQADLLFNAGVNDERKVWGEYVKSTLILQRYVLFKRSNDHFQVTEKFDSVENITIAIRRGYLYGSGPFRQSLDNAMFSGVVYSNSTEQSINMLLKNRVDLFVGDWIPVMHYITNNHLSDKINIVSLPTDYVKNFVVLTWPTHMLFSKKTVSHSYVQEVNAAMEQMKSEGFIDKIFRKYTNGLDRESQRTQTKTDQP